MTAAKVHGIVVHGQCGYASYTRFSISSDIDLALGEDCLLYAKIEVVVRITKDHCPPQEQTIFEWIETNRAAPDTLNYPGLEINLEHRRVFKNGQEVYMSRYEYGVLSLMARHPGQLFTKEQIFEAVWHQDSESCLTAVTNTIGRIRQKIEDDRAVPVYIRTISNLGYQFMPNISVKKDSL